MKAARSPAATAPPETWEDSSRSRAIACGTLGVLVFGLYLATLYPSVAGGDSGELVTVADTLGVAHPPGYPLFTLLGFLFSRLPWGTVAWRVNLLSAVSGSLCAGLLCWAVARWTRRVSAGWLAGGVFALSPLVWRYAIQAEVFALNDFFCAALLALLIAYAQTKRIGLARLAAFTFGLGLSNHHLFLLTGGPCLLALLQIGRDSLARPRRLAELALCGAAGLLPYAYLPWAAAHGPAIAWGDVATAKGFIDHFLRRDYGTFQLHASAGSSADGFFTRLGLYLLSLPGELLGLGILLAFFGLWPGRRTAGTPIKAAVAVSLSLYLLIFHALSNIDLQDPLSRGVQARFWQQPNLLWCAAAGLGLARLRLRSWWPGAIAALAVAAQGGWHFRGADQRGNHTLENYGRAILDSLPRDAILVTQGDLCLSTTRYWQLTQRQRLDVAIVHQNLMSYAWYRPQAERLMPGVTIPDPVYVPGPEVALSLRPFLDANQSRRRVFVCNEGPETADPRREAAYRWVPWGMTDEAVPLGREPEDLPALQRWLEGNQAAFAAFALPPADRFGPDSWEHSAVLSYWKHRNEMVDFLMRAAQREPREDLYLLSGSLLEDIIRNYPDAPPEVYRNLGAIYAEAAKFNPAHQQRAIAAWKQFIARAPASDPESKKLRQMLGMGM